MLKKTLHYVPQATAAGIFGVLVAWLVHVRHERQRRRRFEFLYRLAEQARSLRPE